MRLTPRAEDSLMQLKGQRVVCADEGREEQGQEAATLDKDCQHVSSTAA